MSDTLAALCDFAHKTHVVAVHDELALSRRLVGVRQLELQDICLSEPTKMVCPRPALVDRSVCNNAGWGCLNKQGALLLCISG